jgi:hypothetical protein
MVRTRIASNRSPWLSAPRRGEDLHRPRLPRRGPLPRRRRCWPAGASRARSPRSTWTSTDGPPMDRRTTPTAPCWAVEGITSPTGVFGSSARWATKKQERARPGSRICYTQASARRGRAGMSPARAPCRAAACGGPAAGVTGRTGAADAGRRRSLRKRSLRKRSLRKRSLPKRSLRKRSLRKRSLPRAPASRACAMRFRPANKPPAQIRTSGPSARGKSPPSAWPGALRARRRAACLRPPSASSGSTAAARMRWPPCRPRPRLRSRRRRRLRRRLRPRRRPRPTPAPPPCRRFPFWSARSSSSTRWSRPQRWIPKTKATIRRRTISAATTPP